VLLRYRDDGFPAKTIHVTCNICIRSEITRTPHNKTRRLSKVEFKRKFFDGYIYWKISRFAFSTEDRRGITNGVYMYRVLLDRCFITAPGKLFDRNSRSYIKLICITKNIKVLWIEGNILEKHPLHREKKYWKNVFFDVVRKTYQYNSHKLSKIIFFSYLTVLKV